MVDSVANTTANATDRIGAGTTMLASNFETFLTLLTSQLKNQDPLSPVDSNQFTAQLTQMAGVEQQLLTNDLLKGLLAAQGGGGLAGAATYIGKEATAAWSATKLTDGEATWSYELASNAASARLEVLDGSGNVVWSGDAPDRTTGVHDFTWDGDASSGNDGQEGEVYSLRVTAKDAAGGAIDSQVLTRGRITGVEMYDGVPYLTVGNSILPLSTVIALEESRNAAPPPPANDDGEESLLASIAANLNPLKLFS
ncbi:MAG: flagellar hook assembly protein FlgD [Alphaproteobacteria bacterium]|jgi:flagellar basal-body rod modification protein FlgD|nr:flagellar hook assembly protein FlgD [Alphaproteobacteria bacterium]MBU2043383.1 flagellar hook assembly protein FlgD [Alphaproteobacteria bacterium]MBU2126781.1 flagellar hook assembly protein FlgD [Alphaproteobacteria bacterium]MBU2207279.1 flagellar hook assembly protein FlgD [Alphaproteobacteria bacterium]MBU2292047.1 flagellar hook assembly protein FlgD [Alphaproteobacteria bacterium]